MCRSNERVTVATVALVESVQRWRDMPEVQGSIFDLVLRVLLASPEWRELHYALRELEKDETAVGL